MGLKARMVVSLVSLVALGSVLMVTVVHVVHVRAEAGALREVAETHALFFRETGFPPSVRLAGNLGMLAGATMGFRFEGRVLADPEVSEWLAEAVEEIPAGGGLARRDGAWVAVAAVSPGFDVLVSRLEPPWLDRVGRPLVMAGLAAFWLSALFLAAWLARDLVVPMRALAGAVPRLVEDEPVRSMPGDGRHDEVGQLARAFVEAHRRLGEERMRRERTERLAVLGRMSTGLAHEIQNPVAAVRLHAQLLQTSPVTALPGQLAESMPHITGALDRISSLVNQWLFLARPEPPKTAVVVLDVFLDTALERSRPLCVHGGVEVVRSGRSGLRVRVDARRLEQVVQNIVTNAVQAMSGGGRIEVRVVGKDGYAVMEFRDTGPGFSEAALARGMDLFYSEREGGMGVGLTLAREVVAAHEGKLELGNVPGGGAVVRVILPMVGEGMA